MDRVVAFGRSEFARVEADGREFAIVIRLVNNAGNSVIGGVSIECGRLTRVEMMKDWGSEEGSFEGVESRESDLSVKACYLIRAYIRSKATHKND